MVEPSAALSIASSSVMTTIRQYRMIEGLARVGVAVSGGADSIALLDILHQLRACESFPDLDHVEIIPIHVNQYMRYDAVAELEGFIAQRYGLSLHVIDADTRSVADEWLAKGKAPCRGCAPIRAEAVGVAATRLNLDAVALGHHLNDALATLLMNIFHRGSISTMSPVAARSDHPMAPIIRPLHFTEERIVKAASPVGAEGIFTCNICPLHATVRASAHAYITQVFDRYPNTPAAARAALRQLLT